MTSELIVALTSLATVVAGIAGGGVAWLFRQLRALSRELIEREARCEAQLNIGRRRELVHRQKIAEIGARLPGIDVNGGYRGVLEHLDREERAVLGMSAEAAADDV